MHHRVDALRREAGLREALQERPATLVPVGNRELLAVADARVDDDAPAWQLDDERLHAHRDAPARVSEVGHQPGVACW